MGLISTYDKTFTFTWISAHQIHVKCLENLIFEYLCWKWFHLESTERTITGFISLEFQLKLVIVRQNVNKPFANQQTTFTHSLEQTINFMSNHREMTVSEMNFNVKV